MLAHILSYRKDDRLTLHELFVRQVPADGDTPAYTDTKKLDHLREVARLKVINAFLTASRSDVNRRSSRRAAVDYCLPNMEDDSIDQLVRVIIRGMKRIHDFVRPNDLPVEYRMLTRHWRNSVRAQARYLLLEDVVKELVSKENQLWYHSGHKWWQASQSLMDEYEPLLRKVNNLPNAKRSRKWDDRSWHGRPRRDRSRDTAPGTSVGSKKH